jgi:hypothetical protein
VNEKQAAHVVEFLLTGRMHPLLTVHSFERSNAWHRQLNILRPIFEVFYAVKVSGGYREMEAWIWDIRIFEDEDGLLNFGV